MAATFGPAYCSGCVVKLDDTNVSTFHYVAVRDPIPTNPIVCTHEPEISTSIVLTCSDIGEQLCILLNNICELFYNCVDYPHICAKDCVTLGKDSERCW